MVNPYVGYSVAPLSSLVRVIRSIYSLTRQLDRERFRHRSSIDSISGEKQQGHERYIYQLGKTVISEVKS